MNTKNAIEKQPPNKALTQKTNLKKHLLLSIALVLFIAVTGIFFYKYNSIAIGGGVKPIALLTIAAVVLAAVIAILYALFISKKLGNESVAYFATLVSCGLVFCFLFTPGTVPDEEYHYASSYQYANMLMGIEPSKNSTNMRETDHEVLVTLVSNHRLSRDAYEKAATAATPIFAKDSPRAYYSDAAVIKGSEVTINMSNSPQIKLPSTIGLIAGQLFGLNGLWTFYLGRIFNLVWFSILALIAFKITPLAKPAFVAISLLPMTLHVAASYSYDVSAIGLSMLLISLCLKARYSKTKASKGMLAAIIIAAFLLAPCKVIYSTLILLIFIIPKNKFKDKKSCYLFRILVFVGVFAGLALLSIPSLITISGIEGQQTLERSASENGQTRTIIDLVLNPFTTLFIYLNTIYTHGTFYLNSFLGGTLGWFQTEIAAPEIFMIAYGVVSILSVQKSLNDSFTITKKNKILFASISLMVFIGTLTSMCLAWTYTYEYFIQGVQGRYLLPCGILLLLLLRINRFSTTIPLNTCIPLCMYGLNATYAIFILSSALRIS